MRILASTKDMPYEQWLELRKKSIGGSDSSVILGLNQWRSQYTLWADKCGLLSPTSDNEAMRIGRDLEQYVADRFCEATDKRVRRRNAMFLHDDYDFISANVDREVIGENAGLECKTISVFAKSDFENGEIPLYYYCQCMHYMAVMGYDKMYLAVLVLGKAFYWFEISRNDEEIKSLIDAEVNWWNKYILGYDIPELDGSDSTSATIKELYPEDNGTKIEISSLKTDAEMYINLKAKIKELEATADKYEQAIKTGMGEAESCHICGYEATWKTQHRSSIDTKRLKAENPKIYNEYLRTSNNRVFRIRKLKEA